MEKIMEIEHNKPFGELKPKLLNKIDFLRNKYSQNISLHGIQYFWNEENAVLIVNCDEYKVSMYLVFFPNIIQIYEEVPDHIKPFLSVYRDQFMDLVQNELQEILN